MLHKVGHEIVYHNGAFKTPSNPQASRRWNPLPEQLLDALEVGAKAVLDKSEAKWIVVIKRHVAIKRGFRTDDIMAKLEVYVPVGADQRAELLNALICFEDVIAERLGLPVDVAYRSIEGDSPGCVVCGGKSEWSYPIDTNGYIHFCDFHARLDHRFGDPNFIPVQVASTTI